jgi:hypothetical protein
MFLAGLSLFMTNNGNKRGRDMKTKMLSICILVSAILISLSIAFSACFDFLIRGYDRYDFYADTTRHVVYTFDKYTGEYAKNIIPNNFSGNLNNMR